MTSIQKAITNTRRFFNEGWFSGLFDETKFTADSSPQSTDFQKVATNVVDTSSIDTYDLVFNLQMPSLADTKFFQNARNSKTVDYYCNNKIHIRLYFKDASIFDNLLGTECIISPYLLAGQTSRESDGIYFASLNELREDIRIATNKAIIDGSPFKYKSEGEIDTETKTVKDKKGNTVYDENGNPKVVTVPVPRNPNSPRTGPFADSDEGVTHENIVQKLKTKTFGKDKYIDKYIAYVGAI